MKRKVTLVCIVVLLVAGSCNTKDKSKKIQSDLILSVNAYSFADLMLARDNRDKQQVYTLFNWLNWCSTQNIKAIDPTAYFFPTYPEVPSDEYINKLKLRAEELGIAISGTGIRNNFASPDSAKRAHDVQLAKDWIVVAHKLGAPVIRLFAGAIPEGYEWEEAASWMIDCYKECAEFAEQYRVTIGIQNHGEMLQTADQCLYVLNKINTKNVGLIVDTGNFKTEDPYKDIEKVIPYAVNWQVKESVFGINSEIRTDFKRLITLIKNGGYTGYLPVETLLVRGRPYDPFQLVPEMLNELEEAIKKVY
ncbi:MAG: sugar phosphate isomerase/epimerase [Prolixibacteraceae bacterium]|jgi:sugar phosphate isomerase/epimerase|nr:sugar phosphate isomerase/epimerase [Prolixibacteraceae bacterium]